MSTARMVRVAEIYLNAEPGAGNMVIMKDDNRSDHYFMMFVGEAEFAAISKEKGLLQPVRPLTHELYLGLLQDSGIEFLRVEIHSVREEIFYASVFFRRNGLEIEADSRPSDAVALALNRSIPILINAELFRRMPTPREVIEYEELVKTVKF